VNRTGCLPPTITYVVGVERTTVELILDRSFENVREDGHIVPMTARAGTWLEFNDGRLDLPEVTRRESPPEQICASYRTGSRCLLSGGR
jgi:hypothetical protein